MEKNSYVITFTLIMTITVSLILSFLFYATKDQAELNKKIFEKRAILSSIETNLDKKVSEFSDEEIANIFKDKVEQLVLNMEGTQQDSLLAEDIDMGQERKKPEEEQNLPLFVYKDAGKSFYIMTVRGKGLWDEIWGNIALQDDFTTVAGAAFDHAGETPGLGAEIKDNPTFARQFAGRKIYKNNDYVSVVVKKGGAKDKTNEVDGISGATVTCDGVSEMLYRGIKYYEPYFSQLKGTKKLGLNQ